MPSAATGKATKHRGDRGLVTWLCHFAFWFGVVFATPVFVAAHNPEDLALSFGNFVAGAAVACLLLTVLSAGAASLAGARFQWGLSRLLLALALLAAIQSNFVHDRFDYGNFNGEPVDLSSYGWIFHAEWILWLALLALGLFIFFRLKQLPLWLPLLPVVSFLLLLGSLANLNQADLAAHSAHEEVDPAVFSFSSVGNLIHLLPDGLQAGVVREVLQENPGLAEQFDGFTLYTNHLGMYQGTAPAMYTLLTGEPFALEKGFQVQRVKPELDEKSYQKHLRDRGYRIDYVPIAPIACPDYASSCNSRSFNDMKPRGLFYYRNRSPLTSLRLIADLTLFRLVPMWVKERIYNDGFWFLSDTPLDGTAPWPDPVIREWIDNMTVIDDRPVYKWYHYIGAHIPPHWDAGCNYLRNPPVERESYKAQTACVLSGIAALIRQLKDENIYDQSAILVSSDHGHNTIPDDLASPPINSGLYPGLLGSGRPTLLVKPRNTRHPLEFNDTPTSLVDVAPTALTLAGIDIGQQDIYSFEGQVRRERYYTPYDIPSLWTGHPIPHVRYRVDGPVNDGDEWLLTDIKTFKPAPRSYEKVNFNSAFGFMYGASLNKNEPDADSAWITGNQLAFLLEVSGHQAAPVLNLVLELPDWIVEQQLDIRVNRQLAGSSQLLQGKTGEKQTVSMELDPALLVEGTNFFTIRFRNKYNHPVDQDWMAAALLDSIRLD